MALCLEDHRRRLFHRRFPEHSTVDAGSAPCVGRGLGGNFSDTNGNAPDDDPGRYGNTLKYFYNLVAGARNLLYRTRTEWRRRIKRPLLQPVV
jgi:hypothetical protein